MWLYSDTSKKCYVKNVSCNLKFCVSKHDMARASRKTIMADVSRHTNEHVNFVKIFHDVTSYSMAGILLKVINVFHGEDLALFTVTSIHSIWKSTKKTETPKQDGTQGGKQQKIQGSNRSKDREMELLNKEVWRKRKGKVFNTRIWLIHNAKVT